MLILLTKGEGVQNLEKHAYIILAHSLTGSSALKAKLKLKKTAAAFYTIYMYRGFRS